jgi:hypothetical protein
LLRLLLQHLQVSTEEGRVLRLEKTKAVTSLLPEVIHAIDRSLRPPAEKPQPAATHRLHESDRFRD